MTGPPFPGTTPLDLLDHRCVEADAAVEQKVPALDRPEPDAFDVAGVECLQQNADRIDTVIRKTENAGEDVG